MKQTKHTLITVFALIGMLFIFPPSHLRADEEKALTEALKKDLQDINNYSPFVEFLKLNPPQKNTWAYIEEKGKTRHDDWKKAAEAGIPEGQVLLGLYYYCQSGIGKPVGAVDADLAKEFHKKSVKLYRQAAEQGNADGQYHYAGWSHQDNGGQGGYKEYLQSASVWYRKAAEQGHARAQYALADALYYTEYKGEVGLGWTEGTAVERAKWFLKAAEQGLAEAQEATGMMYGGWGNEVPRNPVKMAEWYLKAAEQGLPLAMVRVGLGYLEGREDSGFSLDYVKAAEWFQKAADLDDSWGEHYLGVCYLEGKGVAKDVEKALELFRHATREGGLNFPGAHYRIAWCYATGTGVEQDIEEALRWIREAEERFSLLPSRNIIDGDKVAALKKMIEEEQQAPWTHRIWNWLTGKNREIRVR